MNFEEREFTAYSIPTTNTNVLLIGAEKGILGCGYLNIETANKVNDVCALVTGVKTPDDMLSAKVVAVSKAAAQLGIKEGMTGKEALVLMS
uniref:YunC family protein n=1 Tax=uncultured Draconibacterium sp. TaxID=1573823 RepID=UPI00321692C8